MNLSNTITASLSLGLITALATAGGGQDPRVRVVELPHEWYYVDVEFSGDGSTIAVTGEWSLAWDIQIHRDDQWKLVSRSINEIGIGQFTSGLSDDGSSLVITDWSFTSIYQDGSTIFMPKWWHETGGVDGQGKIFFTGVISGDGSTVGYSPRPEDSDDNQPVLVWRGENYPEVLLADPDEDGINYEIESLSFDGMAAVASARYQAPHNNLRAFTASREAWVIDDGELTMVPPIVASYEILMHASKISGNGQAVIGSAYGVWRDGLEDDDQIYTEFSNDLIHSPHHSWFWTRESGTVEIENAARFESVGVRDITDDASTVLGAGYSSDGAESQHFLWYSDDNRFLMIDDLFSKLGIVIDADWYNFYQISGDGSKLMGVLNRDGQSSALIVTIPVRNP